MSDGPVAIQDIVGRLVLLSESQRLIEQAKGGYARWYANESDDMLYKPEEVEMEFWRQTLSFQPGIRVQLKPYIATALKWLFRTKSLDPIVLLPTWMEQLRMITLAGESLSFTNSQLITGKRVR